MTPSNPGVQRIAQPSNLLAARLQRLTASLCYAKITPAALHRGKIHEGCRREAEATVRNPEFQLSDSRRRIGVEAAADVKPLCMAAS
jgi:hypothetical protein